MQQFSWRINGATPLCRSPSLLEPNTYHVTGIAVTTHISSIPIFTGRDRPSPAPMSFAQHPVHVTRGAINTKRHGTRFVTTTPRADVWRLAIWLRAACIAHGLLCVTYSHSCRDSLYVWFQLKRSQSALPIVVSFRLSSSIRRGSARLKKSQTPTAKRINPAARAHAYHPYYGFRTANRYPRGRQQRTPSFS